MNVSSDHSSWANWKVHGMLNACLGMAGGAELYEAAVLLKDLLRGRGILLIEDRTDIVGAAEADGVVLSRQGEACCRDNN